jgi:hypothetical protein
MTYYLGLPSYRVLTIAKLEPPKKWKEASKIRGPDTGCRHSNTHILSTSPWLRDKEHVFTEGGEKTRHWLVYKLDLKVARDKDHVQLR